MTLLSTEVHTLWAANKALSKRRRAKKACVRQGGALIVEDTQDIIAQKDVDKQVQHDRRAAEGSCREGQLSKRHYRIYRKAGHNVQTCQEAIDISSLSNAE
jgi:Na+/phosphate symporter